jgi:hypothetical protein
MLRSAMEGYVETRGAKPFDHDRKKFSQYLLAVSEGDIVLTNYMRHRLEDSNYIILVQDEPDGRPGRPGTHVEFTAKSRTLIGMAKAARTRMDRHANSNTKKSKAA